MTDMATFSYVIIAILQEISKEEDRIDPYIVVITKSKNPTELWLDEPDL